MLSRSLGTSYASRNRAQQHERTKVDEATEKCTQLQAQLEDHHHTHHNRRSTDVSDSGAHSTYSLSGVSLHESPDVRRQWQRADEPPLHIVAAPIRGHSTNSVLEGIHAPLLEPYDDAASPDAKSKQEKSAGCCKGCAVM